MAMAHRSLPVGHLLLSEDQVEEIAKGARDAFEGKPSAVALEEAEALSGRFLRQQSRQTSELEMTKGTLYRGATENKPGAQRLPSGPGIVPLSTGEGPRTISAGAENSRTDRPND
jgi:hypothetical protein